MMTMKVERAARGLVDLLLSSLDTEIVLESTVVSGRATPATTVSITVPKKVDIADMDLKPGMPTCVPYTRCFSYTVTKYWASNSISLLYTSILFQFQYMDILK